MPDDQELLLGARRLDRASLAEIHTRYFPMVYRYALLRLGHPHSAEDVASETFERLLTGLHDGKGPRDSLKGWLIRVATNLVNDALRSRLTEREAELHDGLVSHEPDPAALAEWHSTLAEARRLIQSLTAEQQQVLALRFGRGYSIEETAASMRKSISAVKTLQFRALDRLGRHLQVEGHG